VQNWLDNPTADFGWLVLGDETTSGSAKRFDSRENAGGTGPRLTINFTINAPTCNVNIASDVTESGDAFYEACDSLIIGPSFFVQNGANVTLSGGIDVMFEPEVTIIKGATLDVRVCGQSLCETSTSPMPIGCHSCINEICKPGVDPDCCTVEFDQQCVDQVNSVCGLTCD